jgi:serine/threonine-protein kinase haspin
MFPCWLSGFVEVRKCTLFQGEYPPALLQLWDQFNEEKGSENYRPDYLPSHQGIYLKMSKI